MFIAVSRIIVCRQGSVATVCF